MTAESREPLLNPPPVGRVDLVQPVEEQPDALALLGPGTQDRRQTRQALPAKRGARLALHQVERVAALRLGRPQPEGHHHRQRVLRPPSQAVAELAAQGRLPRPGLAQEDPPARDPAVGRGREREELLEP